MTITEKMDQMLINQAVHNEKLDTVIKTQNKHGKTLYGPDDKPGGVVMDVDRNKRVLNVACWFITAIVIAAISVVGKLAYAGLSG
jgi:hypothetical protein